MTNYNLYYPEHRFKRGACIITFDGSYSSCVLSEKQKKYLATSGYLDHARRVDIKLYKGKVLSLTPNQFCEWVNSGRDEPENQYLTDEDFEKEKICPKCGKTMKIRVARRGKGAGQQFWGCSGYPECTYTESIEKEEQQN